MVKASNHNRKELNRLPKRQHTNTSLQIRSTEESIKGVINFV